MSWHPTLDDMEHVPDRPWDHPSRRDNRVEETRALAIGGPYCWCGHAEWAQAWHDGEIDGPHPRETRRQP